MVISRGDRELDRCADGARPIRTVRSTSVVVPFDARSNAITGRGSSCGPWGAIGLPQIRQVVAFWALACPYGQTTAMINESWETPVSLGDPAYGGGISWVSAFSISSVPSGGSARAGTGSASGSHIGYSMSGSAGSTVSDWSSSASSTDSAGAS